MKTRFFSIRKGLSKTGACKSVSDSGSISVNNSANKPRTAAILLTVLLIFTFIAPINSANATDYIENGVLYSSTYFGDVNSDRDINSIDMALLKAYISGNQEASGSVDVKAADLNGDKSIDALDLALLKQMLVGRLMRFPVMDTFISTRDESMLDADLNNTFKISLNENTTTGYQWTYTVSDITAVNLKSVENFTSYAPGVAGASSQKIWTFEALQPGSYTLTYEYRRPWETDVPPLQTVKVYVFVSTVDGCVINVKAHEPFKISLVEGGLAGYEWSYTPSEEKVLLLMSTESIYKAKRNVFDAFSQTTWTFNPIKPGKYTLLFKRRPIETTVLCEINVAEQ